MFGIVVHYSNMYFKQNVINLTKLAFQLTVLKAYKIILLVFPLVAEYFFPFGIYVFILVHIPPKSLKNEKEKAESI